VIDDRDDVRLDVSGAIGRVLLNRPKVLNALTNTMVRRITAALWEWEQDPAVGAVTIAGAGERGLCAGGDIRGIYDDIRRGGTATLALWRDEYRLNAYIGRYPKPVAVMDGLVMGGGVGISAHASHRIVTDRTALAMPEVGIGLVPDVGGTWLLARAPRELGLHAALTTGRLAAGDAISAGFADWYVPADRLGALLAALTTMPKSENDVAGVVAALIADVALPAPDPELADDWIEECYGGDSVEAVLARLACSGIAEAEAAAKEIERKAPTAVKVAFAAIRRARRLGSLEEALNQEYRVSARCFTAPDLLEGIRAQVIDKDHDPRWQPATLEEVTDADVQAYFEPLDSELGLLPTTRSTDVPR
jgi:enoyl-CoA hydratase